MRHPLGGFGRCPPHGSAAVIIEKDAKWLSQPCHVLPQTVCVGWDAVVLSCKMAEPTLPRFTLFNTEAIIFHSTYADQDFQIGVWLPFSYTNNREQAYPVLYVPDGEYAFPVAAGLMPTLMGAGEAPEMLMVGIAYHGISSWAELGVLRDRDFCTQPFQSPPHQTRHAQYTRFFAR